MARAYGEYSAKATDLDKNVYPGPAGPQRGAVHRLLGEYLTEMLPIVCNPTVGTAIERSHENRRPRGVCR